MLQSKWYGLILLFLLAACVEAPQEAFLTETAAPPAEPTPMPTAVSPTQTPPSTETASPPAATSAPTTESIIPLNAADLTFPAPAAPYPLFAQASITAAETRTVADLETNLPLERDDVALALAYTGLTAVPDTEDAIATEPLPAGTIHAFSILNISNNTRSTVEAELKAVGEHAYFWFDVSAGNAVPSAEQLQTTAASFDQIYEEVIRFFGEEDSPGIDGDARVHIFNASPTTICSVTVETAAQCGLLGYFSAADILPVEVYAQSNEREMFVMNGSRFGSGGYLEVLAHEFRHMIEANHDRNDWDWEVEGSAMLAEDLVGYTADAYGRANLFLSAPDQQLNRWSDGHTTPRYGQGYLLNRYIFDRLGRDLYLEFAQSEEAGLEAITAVAAANGLAFDGHDLWLDWLVALAVHDRPQVPERYELPGTLNTAASERVLSYPFTGAFTVQQYGADYYTLLGEGAVTVTFKGSTHTPLLDTQPPSGSQMWVANRANFSQARLTRPVDLTAVDSATLQYDVYHDIEAGYDFAYVAVSADGGQTWRGVQTAGMQSQTAGDDPSQSAWTPYFYTGQSGRWLTETADLTPYAGQEIHLRFEYVTDPILTFGGLAIDNIAIPEIGYMDDAERDSGWTAEGFVRATGHIPQRWHLQLIEFVDGRPTVNSLTLNDEQMVTFTLNLQETTQNTPILIIAATAPMTLEAAHYQLNMVQP